MKAIVESVAWDNAKSSGANIGAKGSRAYFESAAVSLWSVKRTNPDWEALLVTNTEVPSDVRDILDGFGAIVIHQPFEKFSFPFDVPWHLAYYKLCAVDSVLSSESYQYVCMLDTDTWVRGSLEELYASSRGGVSMIDLHAPLADRDRRAMETDLKHIGIEKPECFLPFYGGELLCGGVSELRLVLDACSYVHRKMVSHGYVSKRGDEFLLYASTALGSLPTVVSANGYATRCWTGRYYSVPRWEDLAILHLPAEKVYSFPRAFKKLNHMGQIDPAWFERSCGLRQSRRPVSPLWMAKRSLDKVLKR